jgi:hypothetical protein
MSVAVEFELTLRAFLVFASNSPGDIFVSPDIAMGGSDRDPMEACIERAGSLSTANVIRDEFPAICMART